MKLNNGPVIGHPGEVAKTVYSQSVRRKWLRCCLCSRRAYKRPAPATKERACVPLVIQPTQDMQYKRDAMGGGLAIRPIGHHWDRGQNKQYQSIMSNCLRRDLGSNLDSTRRLEIW